MFTFLCRMVGNMRIFGFEVLTAVLVNISVFCGPLNINRSFGGADRLHFWGPRIRQTRNQPESKVAKKLCLSPAKCSSETSVEFQRSTRRYIPEDRILQENIWISGVRK
jgi:hypothetical protein